MPPRRRLRFLACLVVGDGLEPLDRIRYGADLILAFEAGHGDAEVTLGELQHGPLNALQRNDHAPRHQQHHPHRKCRRRRQHGELHQELPRRHRLLPGGMLLGHIERRIGHPEERGKLGNCYIPPFVGIHARRLACDQLLQHIDPHRDVVGRVVFLLGLRNGAGQRARQRHARGHLLQRCPRRLVLAHVRRVDEHGLGWQRLPRERVGHHDGGVTASVARHPGELLDLHQLVNERILELDQPVQPHRELVQHSEQGADFVTNFRREPGTTRCFWLPQGCHRFFVQRGELLDPLG